ncbi:unnamed protein product [Linum trigynum]|uniref:Protein kinase domain-containing protein n=1 Tax=Linum trigynum TaxID=586398 RepID=A0AAV2G2W9_9ROSI
MEFTALLLLLLSIFTPSSAFVPTDNYLLNCGSTANATLDDRVFAADSAFLAADRSTPLANQNPSPSSPELYATARVFTSASGYKLNIRQNGTHLVRLHFSPFPSPNFNLSAAKFTLLLNGNSVLRDFSTEVLVIKEYLFGIDGEELEILLRPAAGGSNFGFVNAIEVFSAPKDLIIDRGARIVSPNAIGEFDGMSSRILEMIHRINVGGSKMTPFNDTLWRTWVPDEGFLVLKPAAKKVVSTHPPNYQAGGATRETAPDHVYMTAQSMNRGNAILGAKFNISWNFPVGSSGVQHLVRLHFCDIVSTGLNLLYFNVYLNDLEAYKDMDLSSLTFHELGSPMYVDFVADSDDLGKMRVSVGPSDLSTSTHVNAILNGVEIMKMVNLAASGSVSSEKKKRRTWIIVGSILGGGFGLLLLAGLMVLLACRCRKKKQMKNPRSRRTESSAWTTLRGVQGSSRSRMTELTITGSPAGNGYHNLRIPFAEVQSATNNFDKNLIIGMGGFGMVYKGVLKDANIKVAVKRGVPGHRQGLPEFQTEITVLSRIRHRHLVSLVGYCEEQSEMILVYEYMENGPLKSHLYGQGQATLTWKQRLEICIGAARGIHYLHTGFIPGIIHRDIKSTNILLDENHEAKVADFGLSRAGPCLDETHVSTGVKGSFGYLDPEYFRRQQLTDKSDVYSFGVVMLEVLCARPAIDPLLAREQVNLAEWALQWKQSGRLDQIIDPKLRGQIKHRSLEKFVETAEKCLAEYGVDRPSMGDVLWNLEYALQVQESGSLREDSNANGDPVMVVGNGDRSEENCSSEASTALVFSQLVTNEGR